MPTNTSKYQGIGSLDPASETGMGLNDFGSALGLGLEDRLARQNRPSTTVATDTEFGTREVYSPGSSFYSNDPLQGTIFESGAFLGLDPLGIFDVPQIQVDLERLDPQYIADLTARQARANALRSQALEEELTPEVAAARRQAMQQLLGDIQAGGDISGDLQSILMEQLGANTDIAMPELQRSNLLDRAREMAMSDLELGGELPQELRNLVARESAGRASGGGFLGGQIGRDISARDLGLTSIDLRNQRMARAAQLGAGEEATNIQQQGLAANIAAQNRAFQQQNLMNLSQQISGLRQQEFANRFGMAQFTQGIEQPIAGIDPGDLASFVVGDINQRNQLVNQANQAQLQATTQAKGNQLDLFGDVAQGLMGMFCWVARACFSEDAGKDGEWHLFRFWLHTEAPEWLYEAYKKHGEYVAEVVNPMRRTKKVIAYFMRKAIKGLKG